MSNMKSALRDEGYAWEPKTRYFTKNSGKKLEKILVFSFSQIYDVLMVGIFWTKSQSYST